MNFENLPLQTQLQLILNDLTTCHVLGADALKFGNTLKALEVVVTQQSENKEQ